MNDHVKRGDRSEADRQTDKRKKRGRKGVGDKEERNGK